MTGKLTSDEAQAIKAILSQIVIRGRTGEVGIMHGADRFVSTNLCLRKYQIEILQSAAKAVGLSKVATTEK